MRIDPSSERDRRCSHSAGQGAPHRDGRLCQRSGDALPPASRPTVPLAERGMHGTTRRHARQSRREDHLPDQAPVRSSASRPGPVVHPIATDVPRLLRMDRRRGGRRGRHPRSWTGAQTGDQWRAPVRATELGREPPARGAVTDRRARRDQRPSRPSLNASTVRRAPRAIRTPRGTHSRTRHRPKRSHVVQRCGSAGSAQITTPSDRTAAIHHW